MPSADGGQEREAAPWRRGRCGRWWLHRGSTWRGRISRIGAQRRSVRFLRPEPRVPRADGGKEHIVALRCGCRSTDGAGSVGDIGRRSPVRCAGGFGPLDLPRQDVEAGLADPLRLLGVVRLAPPRARGVRGLLAAALRAEDVAAGPAVVPPRRQAELRQAHAAVRHALVFHPVLAARLAAVRVPHGARRQRPWKLQVREGWRGKPATLKT
mmetsp:Transcript_104850/g.296581  ORF Transcript_104850/g.296581 Transcript_104850/m.296581 type:complete len:211 (-) Transcript_104850:19-651(-)